MFVPKSLLFKVGILVWYIYRFYFFTISTRKHFHIGSKATSALPCVFFCPCQLWLNEVSWRQSNYWTQEENSQLCSNSKAYQYYKILYVLLLLPLFKSSLVSWLACTMTGTEMYIFFVILMIYCCDVFRCEHGRWRELVLSNQQAAATAGQTGVSGMKQFCI